MSHLERDILKGKFGNNPQLKKEAREESAEEKIEKKTGKHVKVREMAGKMKVDYGKLAEKAQARHYKRNLSSREIQSLKKDTTYNHSIVSEKYDD